MNKKRIKRIDLFVSKLIFDFGVALIFSLGGALYAFDQKATGFIFLLIGALYLPLRDYYLNSEGAFDE